MSTLNSSFERYAVIVGINDYEGSSCTSLNYCSNDAEAFYETLIHHANYKPDNIFLYSDSGNENSKKPEYTNILSKVSEMCTKATEEDSILFFFAGHGTKDEKDSYLLTREFKNNIIEDSSIPMQKINSYYFKSKAKFKLRIFDACHSGRMGRRNTLSNPNIEKDFTIDAEGWATLAACKEDQYAHEIEHIGHGIFSYFLVKAISGEASSDNNLISLDDVKRYVMTKTVELTTKLGLVQTPVFSGEQAGNLTISTIKNLKLLNSPQILKNIEAISEEELKPSSSKLTLLFNELNSILETPNKSKEFVASSQTQKTKRIQHVSSLIENWANDYHKLYKENDFPSLKLSYVLEPIEKNPYNKQLARHLEEKKLKDHIEWEFISKKEVKYITEKQVEEEPNYFVPSFNKPKVKKYIEVKVPHESYVLSSIKPRDGYEISNNSLKIVLRPTTYLAPCCILTIVIIPSSFGAYLICYMASTKLANGLKEVWHEKTFKVDHLSALSQTNTNDDTLIKEFDEVYARFISFMIESAKERQIELEALGAVPNSSSILN